MLFLLDDAPKSVFSIRFSPRTVADSYRYDACKSKRRDFFFASPTSCARLSSDERSPNSEKNYGPAKTFVHAERLVCHVAPLGFLSGVTTGLSLFSYPPDNGR